MSETVVSSEDDKTKAVGLDNEKVGETDVASLKVDVEKAENDAAAASSSGEVFGNLSTPRVSQYIQQSSTSGGYGPEIQAGIKSLSKEDSRSLKGHAKKFALQALQSLKQKLSGEIGDRILQKLADADFAGNKEAAQKHLRDKVVSEAVHKYIKHFVQRKLNKQKRSASMIVTSDSLTKSFTKSKSAAALPPSSRPKSAPVGIKSRSESAVAYEAVEFRPGHPKGKVVKEGFLTKLATRQFVKPGGGDRKSHSNWKKRYFRMIQCPTNVLLEYFVDGSLQDLKGAFTFTPGLVVKLCPVSHYPKYNHVFQVTDGNGPRCIVKFIGYAVDADTAADWVATIRKTLDLIPSLSRIDEF